MYGGGLPGVAGDGGCMHYHGLTSGHPVSQFVAPASAGCLCERDVTQIAKICDTKTSHENVFYYEIADDIRTHNRSECPCVFPCVLRPATHNINKKNVTQINITVQYTCNVCIVLSI